jgi:hypothetical protein
VPSRQELTASDAMTAMWTGATPNDRLLDRRTLRGDRTHNGVIRFSTPRSPSMSHTNRRTFMFRVVTTGSMLAAAQAYSQTGPKLEESDPQALALSYKSDTSKVDAKKFPNHAASQSCASCQLFQGKAGDAAGGCPLFAGKQVAATGWCSAWVKKAG